MLRYTDTFKTKVILQHTSYLGCSCVRYKLLPCKQKEHKWHGRILNTHSLLKEETMKSCSRKKKEITATQNTKTMTAAKGHKFKSVPKKLWHQPKIGMLQSAICAMYVNVNVFVICLKTQRKYNHSLWTITLCYF